MLLHTFRKNVKSKVNKRPGCRLYSELQMQRTLNCDVNKKSRKGNKNTGHTRNNEHRDL